MKAMTNRKGFTLVELIVVIAIIGSVMTVATSFLLNNVKLFNKENQKIDVQQEAQLAMNGIIDMIMEAEKMVSISHNGSNLDIMVFQIEEDRFIGYKLDEEDGVQVLKRGVDSDSTIGDMDTFARYVEKCEVTLLPEGVADIEDVQGISVEVTCQKEGAATTLNNEVYFRNWK